MAFLKYKRGNAILDNLTTIIILFIFAVFSIVGYWVYGQINDDIQSDAEISTEAKELADQSHSNFSSLFDGLFIFLFMLLWIMMLVSSFMIDSHPIFFIISVLGLVFVLVISGVIANVWGETIVIDEDLGTVISSFPMTHWMMSHLMHVIVVVAFSVLIALFGKSRYGQ